MDSGLRITFLGTGTSQGVPLIACPCPTCISTNPKDKRLRSSILIQYQNKNYVIDAGPDFRQQMLTHNVKTLDGLIITHAHMDHIAGLDEIRAFNFIEEKSINVYATLESQATIKQVFSYAFANLNYPGLPQINLQTIHANNPFAIDNLTFTPIAVMHHKMPVLGFRMHDFTYITDANYISPTQIEKIKGSKILVLNALRHQEHLSHFTLEQAIQIATQSQIPQTYFTHLSHQIGLHLPQNNNLPQGMQLAYDGLQLSL